MNSDEINRKLQQARYKRNDNEIYKSYKDWEDDASSRRHLKGVEKRKSGRPKKCIDHE